MPRRLSAARPECQGGSGRYTKTIFLRLDLVEIGSVKSGQFIQGIHSLDVSKTRTKLHPDHGAQFVNGDGTIFADIP
jgi:hypothetical protein